MIDSDCKQVSELFFYIIASLIFVVFNIVLIKNRASHSYTYSLPAYSCLVWQYFYYQLSCSNWFDIGIERISVNHLTMRDRAHLHLSSLI